MTQSPASPTVKLNRSMVLYTLSRPDTFPSHTSTTVILEGLVDLDYLVQLMGEDAVHRAIALGSARFVAP